MASLEQNLASYWNSIVIISILVIIVIFIVELDGLRKTPVVTREKFIKNNPNTEMWIRKNKDFNKKLNYVDSENFKRSLFVIHEDFKSLLENKFSLASTKKRIKGNNLFYIKYIADPDLKEFMKDPLLWFQPYFNVVVNNFVGNKRISRYRGSRVLFPVFLDLERKIIAEINDDLQFRYVNIDKAYENNLVHQILRSKKYITWLLLLFDVTYGIFLVILQINFIEIFVLEIIGLLVTYIYYKLNTI